MTGGGYIKRFPVAEYRAQNRGGVGVTGHRPKEDDFVEQMFVCSTHVPILFFSNFGKVYSIKGTRSPKPTRRHAAAPSSTSCPLLRARRSPPCCPSWKMARDTL